MATTIQDVSSLCDTCVSTPTPFECFQARHLDARTSFAMRYGLFEQSEIFRLGLFTFISDAVDGAEFRQMEFVGGPVQSRSTGGRSKFDCGKFDPSHFLFKELIKRQQTELLYVEREICNLNQIASIFQGGQNGAPNWISNTGSLTNIAQGVDMSMKVMEADLSALLREIDGTAVLGNWAGTFGTSAGTHKSVYPHFDGIIKKALLQKELAYYHAVTVTLPAQVNGDCYYLESHGNVLTGYQDVATLVAGINALRNDVDGTQPYSASFAAQVVTIVANEEGRRAYGEGHLAIYYSADCTVDACNDSLVATEIQCEMPYHETPTLFDYGPITESNFYDTFKTVVKTIKQKLNDLYKEGQLPEGLIGTDYIAIDPDLLVEKQVEELEKYCSCAGAPGEQIELFARFFPRFVPLKALQGTGMWFWTFPSNVVYMTNIESPDLAPFDQWYDPECRTIKTRLEILGNVEVLDYNLFATNAQNSNFSTAALAKPVYLPENLPHYCDSVRSNCKTDCCISDFEDGFVVNSTHCYEANGMDWDLNLADISTIPDGTAITEVQWTVYLSTGAMAMPPTGTSVTITITDAEFQILQFVEQRVTLDNGDIEYMRIPISEFELCPA